MDAVGLKVQIGLGLTQITVFATVTRPLDDLMGLLSWHMTSYDHMMPSELVIASWR